jgi:alpha-glucosidase
MYLPKETAPDAGNVWIDYHTGDRRNAGTTTEDRSLYVDRDGQHLFHLPVFVRAGAILPAMRVDDLTLDSRGHRSDGTTSDDLVVKVFADPSRKASSFRLVEDDGATVSSYVASDRGFARPTYARRTTDLRQTFDGTTLEVTIAAAEGTYAGAPDARDNEVRIVRQAKQVATVVLDGAPLAKAAGTVATPGTWVIDAAGTLVVRTGAKPVTAQKTIEVSFQ